MGGESVRRLFAFRSLTTHREYFSPNAGIYLQRTVKGLPTTFTLTRRHGRSCRVVLDFGANLLLFPARTAHVGIGPPRSSGPGDSQTNTWNQ